MSKKSISKSKYKIIYIVGPARSGSTILEILLSHGKNTFGAGELTHIVEDGFIKSKKCSCGKKFKDCEVWRRIVEKINMSEKTLEIWNQIQKKIDWHDGFIKQLINLISKNDWHIYKTLNKKLFDVIHEITNANFIIDSSKYAGKALALWKIFKRDIYYICLVRSPEGLMSSFQKPNKDEQLPKKPFQVFAYYFVVMFLLRILFFLIPKTQIIYISYEEFIYSPLKVILKIEKFCNIDLEQTKKRLKNDEYFEVGHLVTGNRLRKLRKVKFNPSLGRPKLRNLKEKFFVILMKFVRLCLGFKNYY